jgi:hypothetical protein
MVLLPQLKIRDNADQVEHFLQLELLRDGGK